MIPASTKTFITDAPVKKKRVMIKANIMDRARRSKNIKINPCSCISSVLYKTSANSYILKSHQS